MGLLEKAGQMQNEEGAKPAKKSKPKPVKAAKPAKKSKPRRASRKKSSDDLDDIEVTPKVAKKLPDEYVIAKKPARFARSLVDFIVSFGWAVPIVVISLWGSMFDATYPLIGGALLSIFNLVAMPFMTNRTVGNYASLTQYVTHKGKPPVFLHQTLKAMTMLYIAVGLFLVLSAGVGTTAGANTVNLGIGLAILAIPLSDWVIARVRHETKQGLWDSIFFAYMVSHTRPDDAETTGFFGKLESSGDWLKDKGWLGDEKSED